MDMHHMERELIKRLCGKYDRLRESEAFTVQLLMSELRFLLDCAESTMEYEDSLFVNTDLSNN